MLVVWQTDAHNLVKNPNAKPVQVNIHLNNFVDRTFARVLQRESQRTPPIPRSRMQCEWQPIPANTNVSSALVAATICQELERRSVTIKHPHAIGIREFQDEEKVPLLDGP